MCCVDEETLKKIIEFSIKLIDTKHQTEQPSDFNQKTVKSCERFSFGPLILIVLDLFLIRICKESFYWTQTCF